MRRTPRQAAIAACVLAVAGALSSCGGSDHVYKNAARPPSPIVISAAINDSSVVVSPKRFGAGPITLIISNQSSQSQQVTLETDSEPGDSGPGQKAIQTGPINPRETASVKGQVVRGVYALRVGGEDIRAARVTVGRQRASAQNELLNP
jgi:hypothetical protein